MQARPRCLQWNELERWQWLIRSGTSRVQSCNSRIAGLILYSLSYHGMTLQPHTRCVAQSGWTAIHSSHSLLHCHLSSPFHSRLWGLVCVYPSSCLRFSGELSNVLIRCHRPYLYACVSEKEDVGECRMSRWLSVLIFKMLGMWLEGTVRVAQLVELRILSPKATGSWPFFNHCHCSSPYQCWCRGLPCACPPLCLPASAELSIISIMNKV